MCGSVEVKYTISFGGAYCSIAYLLKTDVFCIVMCCCIIPDILKDHKTFILSVEWNGGSAWATLLRHCVPLEFWELFPHQQCNIPQAWNLQKYHCENLTLMYAYLLGDYFFHWY
jgi:hypothetical protein